MVSQPLLLRHRYRGCCGKKLFSDETLRIHPHEEVKVDAAVLQTQFNFKEGIDFDNTPYG